ncbi:MAG TPA: L,D-transpeptidase [Anaerolineales bacterium]|nr:L,D-transpeptidase [Anaerolineales bacterium]
MTARAARPLRIAFLLAFGLLLLAAPPSARAGHADLPPEGAICTPRRYREDPEHCPPLGPGPAQERLAAESLVYPFRPFPAHAPSRDLVWNPYAIARVRDGEKPIFASLDDAVAGEPVYQWLEAGFRYVSYIYVESRGGDDYYQIDFGRWMRGKDLAPVAGSSAFQGLEFTATPRNAFGWVLFERESKRSPGLATDDYNGETYYRFDVVQIYAVRQAEGGDWYLIGPDEWLEGRLVAAVFPKTTPPEGVDNGRWIEINLAEQTLAVYEDHRLVFATAISTGGHGQWTRPGLHQAYRKVADETMQGSFTLDRSDYYYLEGVVWTVYFDAARAMHGAYWHSGFGVPLSRGCVNLSTGDAQWVFNWIEEGDWVYVHDPSGETPTDPALYGDGGA